MPRPRELLFRGGFVLGALTLLAAGLITWTQWPQTLERGNIPSTAAVPAGATGSTPIGATNPTLNTAGRNLSPGQRRPLSLHIPSLGIDAPIEAVTVNADGALAVPADPSHLGWWSAGPAPGAPQGTAVIDGHVDWTGIGPGALFHLTNIKIGADVIITETAGPIRFRVAALREYPKATLPWQHIFNQNVASRLVLITCGGKFNPQTHSYHDNIVAYAVPVSS